MIRLPAPAADDWESARDGADVAIAASSNSPRSDDVAAATQSMQTLRLVQPPPAGADDGGAYSRPQLLQHARFDGTGAPVGPATASAHGPLDPVLVAGLENSRERLTLLKFEDQIVRFLKNPREPHLNFPPLSSYHRLIVHRLAQRCALEHQTADYNPYEGSSARVVTLFKTPQSAVPRVLLIDLSTDRQTPAVTPASAPKIMMRKRGAQRPGANGGRGNGADGRATRSMQDRERAYAEARARIFGDDNAAESVSSSSPSSTTSSAHEGTGGGNSTVVNGGARLGSRQAAGPDGSRGFGRGRGATTDRPASAGAGGLTRDTRSTKERSEASNGSSGSSEYVPPRSSSNGRGGPSAQNTALWKESKVLWRNREQEMNDPDFTRNHDAFRPRSSGGASSGSGSGGDSPFHGGSSSRYGSGSPVPRFGHGDYHQYDRSFDRSYGGYQPQQGGGAPLPPPPPPLPAGAGRGRYLAAGGPEFNNRVETNMYQPPQQQLNPPPVMMGRGGYAYPSPHGRPSPRQANWMPPQANNRGGRFIDDDFPPLGK